MNDAQLLEVSSVSVRFGGLQALDDVSLGVPGESVVGLIGSNGAGKTTLFNVLSGLQAPDSGTVRFDGRDITSLGPHVRAHLGIGRSFQNLGMNAEETVRTNLLAAQYVRASYGLRDVFLRPWRWLRAERRLLDRALEVLDAFGLVDRLDDPVGDLSFGEARFVEIAAVLAGRPSLLLFDEPTTGLDVDEVATLDRALRGLRDEGATILVVAHDVRFIMGLCDEVNVLAEGKMLCTGPPEVVQRDPAVAEAYLGAGVDR